MELLKRNGLPDPETLGYVVIEAGSGTMEAGSGTMETIDYTAALGSNTIQGIGNDPPYSYPLSGFSSVSSAVVSSAGMNDPDGGGWPLLYGDDPVTPGQLNLAIDEDTRGDIDRAREIPEQLAYIVFGDRGPGVTITETSGSTDVAEGGTTDTYNISLSTIPIGSVEVTVTADEQSEVSLDGTSFLALRPS